MARRPTRRIAVDLAEILILQHVSSLLPLAQLFLALGRSRRRREIALPVLAPFGNVLRGLDLPDFGSQSSHVLGLVVIEHEFRVGGVGAAVDAARLVLRHVRAKAVFRVTVAIAITAVEGVGLSGAGNDGARGAGSRNWNEERGESFYIARK